MKKLRKDFIGTKRFCSTQCAHAFSGSRRGSGGKNKKKFKLEKRLVKKSEPRSRVKRQQRSRGAVSSSQQEEADEVEVPAEQVEVPAEQVEDPAEQVEVPAEQVEAPADK